MNFSYIVIPPSDEEWGVLKNGSWSGMVGQLAEGQIEIGE